MRNDAEKVRRRSIRLSDYNYRQAGAYFVTICTHNHQCLFGEIVDGAMRLNGHGQIVADEWLRTAVVRPSVGLDAFVVMPNHLHGIVVLQGRGLPAASLGTPTAGTPPACPYRFGRSVSGSLAMIIGQFKSVVTKRINEARTAPNAPVWQRNYYEHVIRNEDKLNRIRHYIEDNPARWHADPENPLRLGRTHWPAGDER